MPQRLTVDLPNMDFNISMECLEDLIIIGTAAAATNQSEISSDLSTFISEMMDAMAKEPPGVRRGAQNFFGFKQECDILKYTVPNRSRTLQTSYSRAYMNAYRKPNCNNSDDPIIGFDICMPSSCTSDDLKIALALSPIVAPEAGLPNFCSVTTFQDINEPMTTMSWIMVSFFIIIGTLAVLAGITDYCLLPSDNPIRETFGIKLFLAFSFYTNVTEILKIPKYKKDQIGPINCLRVISMCWVIVSHTVANCIGYTNNALDYIKILDYPLSEIIENAWFSVDTFFFISGVLLAFMWFNNYEKDKTILTSPFGWILFYVHRFIRLSTPYYVLLLSFTYLFGPITQNMPLFFTKNPEENICKKYLWKNLLYIFNFNLDQECLAHAWYLATDLQMYIFTPLILIPLAINPVFGWIIATILLLLSTTANIVTVYVKDYPATQAFFGPGKMSYNDIM
uniref:Nose resistant-to-fluoxetine protein N-terminal domain-containing protein n=1 Tax=Panagrolaimus superbus TaxID=310955 RepID=A0A914XX72_9BILA